MSLQNKLQCTNEQCQKTFESQKRKCDICGSVVAKITKQDPIVIKQSNTEEKYINLGETRSVNKKKMLMGEPIMLNPNSYDNINILKELKEDILVNGRVWTLIGCDGPPYCIASRIISNDKDLYDWVSMFPGVGHQNMN